MIPILMMLLQAAAPVAAPPPGPPPPPPWTPQVRVSAATGLKSTSVTAPAREHDGRLVLRCDSGAQRVVSVQFIAAAPIGGGADRPVSLIADTGMPLIANWEFPGSTGTFIREDAAVTTLAATIAGARVIRIHTTNLAGAPIDASFAGPPSDAPVRAVLAACGYMLGQVPARQPPPDAAPAAPAP